MSLALYIEDIVFKFPLGTQCGTLLTDILTDQIGFQIKDFLFYGKVLHHLVSAN